MSAAGRGARRGGRQLLKEQRLRRDGKGCGAGTAPRGIGGTGDGERSVCCCVCVFRCQVKRSRPARAAARRAYPRFTRALPFPDLSSGVYERPRQDKTAFML